VIHREQEERDDEGGEGDSGRDLHDALGLVVRGEKLIVKEAREDVADEDFEVTLVALWSQDLCLNA
jgi:hypothetical protein